MNRRLMVRYSSGASDEWWLTPQVEIDDLASSLTTALRKGYLVGIPVQTESGEHDVNFGHAFIRLSEVVALEIDGFVDEEAFDEGLQTFSGSYSSVEETPERMEDENGSPSD